MIDASKTFPNYNSAIIARDSANAARCPALWNATSAATPSHAPPDISQRL